MEKKRNKKAITKNNQSKSRQFKSVNLLDDCFLEDQEVIDEESENLKTIRKHKVDDFTNEYETILNERGFCDEKGKYDSSLKAHARRYFLYFDTAKHGKDSKDYFDAAQYRQFLEGDKSDDDHWFCDRDVVMSYFTDVVANLVQIQPKTAKKSKHAMQLLIKIELYDVRLKRHTGYFWRLDDDIDFKTHLGHT